MTVIVKLAVEADEEDEHYLDEAIVNLLTDRLAVISDARTVQIGKVECLHTESLRSFMRGNAHE